MAEGDSISYGNAKDNLPYTFTATEDKSTYSFSQGAITETKNGMFAYQGAFSEEFDATANVETALTDQGFYNVTLSPGTSYRYKYDIINLSLENTDARKDITVCKGVVEKIVCDVQQEGNAISITGKNKLLTQDGYQILQSFDPNNVIKINFAEKTATFNNINPREDLLAIFNVGYFEIREMKDTIITTPILTEHPIVFRNYDSDKPFPPIIIDYSNALVYQDENSEAKILPTEKVHVDTCIVKVREKILGRGDGKVPAFC